MVSFTRVQPQCEPLFRRMTQEMAKTNPNYILKKVHCFLFIHSIIDLHCERILTILLLVALVNSPYFVLITVSIEFITIVISIDYFKNKFSYNFIFCCCYFVVNIENFQFVLCTLSM